MQIMGAVARERGCGDPFLPVLCDVETNLQWGCAHLGSLLEWADGDVLKTAAAWNAGTGGWLGAAGQGYAAKVNRTLEAIQAARR
jgi:soluble lytic murein transglycosylase-like protein